jgi:hypothetical protein
MKAEEIINKNQQEQSKICGIYILLDSIKYKQEKKICIYG